MDVSDDLVTWLRAQLDEDERVAQRPAPAPWFLMGEPAETRIASAAGIVVALGWRRDLEHMARHDPARVLAEIDAKRRILDMYAEVHADPARLQDPGLHAAWYLLRRAVCLLALPYADRPGYRQEWAL